MVYIGDTVSDVLACKKVGVECLSAAWAKNAPAPALEDINPGNVVLSIAELKRDCPCKLFIATVIFDSLVLFVMSNGILH